MAKLKKDYSPTDQDLEFADFAVEVASPKSDIPWYKSIPARTLKGAVEGLTKFGEEVSPAARPQQIEESQKQRQKFYEENLPLGDNFLGKSLERGLEAAPSLLAIPGSGLLSNTLRSLGAGLLGQSAEELGFGPSGQALAELPAYGAPSLRRRIPLARGERELGEFARRSGLTEQDLTLSLGKRGPLRDLGVDISSKGGRTVARFEGTQRNLGRVWDDLRSSPQAMRTLDAQGQQELVRNLTRRMNRLPAEQRNRIMRDYDDLLESNFSGDSLINFWQDLNYYISRGETGLGILKRDLQNSLMRISPELGNDFRLLNRLYGNFSELAGRMGPNIADALINAGERGLVIHAISTGNLPILKKIIGPIAGRQFARELVTNPRFYNTSRRFVQGIAQGSPAIARKAYDKLLREVGSSNAELAKKMAGFNVEEFIDSIPSNPTKEEK